MYVHDHAAGVEAALLCGRRGEVYNLAPASASEAVTADIIEQVRSLVGKGQIERVQDRDNYDLRYWMDASKAAESLNWKARFDLHQTVNSTVAWYLSNTSWLEAATNKLVSGG